MIAKRIIEVSQHYPGKTAIIDSDSFCTYSELAEAINECCNFFEELSIEENEPVGLYMANKKEYLIILLACELKGIPTVLLSTTFHVDELNYHINESGLRYVFTDREWKLDNFKQKTEILNMVNIWEKNDFESKNQFEKNDFICQLTSGTSGRSKGAIRSSDAVLLEIEETLEMLDVSSSDTFLTLSPLCHSFGLIAGALLPLLLGCTLVLQKAFSMAGAKKAIRNHNASVLFAVPFMYKMMLDSSVNGEDNFDSLKICVSAGAPMSEKLHREFHVLTGIFVTQDYGSTETGVMTINCFTEEYPDSVGKGVGKREFKIMDDNGIELKDGNTGLIYTKSNCDLRKYAYPEECNVNIKDGWLCLGDIGTIKDGYLYVKGRRSNMINVGGLKVDPDEIEKVLLELDGIDEAVVVGQKSETYGEVVKAHIVRRRDISLSDIIEHCKKRISSHKIPKIINFVDEIPKSATGKILRKYLA